MSATVAKDFIKIKRDVFVELKTNEQRIIIITSDTVAKVFYKIKRNVFAELKKELKGDNEQDL